MKAIISTPFPRKNIHTPNTTTTRRSNPVSVPSKHRDLLVITKHSFFSKTNITIYPKTSKTYGRPHLFLPHSWDHRTIKPHKIHDSLHLTRSPSGPLPQICTVRKRLRLALLSLSPSEIQQTIDRRDSSDAAHPHQYIEGGLWGGMGMVNYKRAPDI